MIQRGPEVWISASNFLSVSMSRPTIHLPTADHPVPPGSAAIKQGWTVHGSWAVPVIHRELSTREERAAPVRPVFPQGVELEVEVGPAFGRAEPLLAGVVGDAFGDGQAGLGWALAAPHQLDDQERAQADDVGLAAPGAARGSDGVVAVVARADDRGVAHAP